MDINFLRAELTNLLDKSEEFVQQRIQMLIDKLDGELEVRLSSASVISEVLATVEGYNQTYLSLLAEYSAIPVEDVKARINKIHEILCTVSALSTYLTSSCAQYLTGALEDTSHIAKHIRTLELKKDYFNSEKIVWQSLLKSLTQTVAKETEIIKFRTMELRNNIIVKENS